MANRFKTAIEIQDACNPRAVAGEFVRMMDEFIRSPEYTGTQSILDDAALILMVNKLESLFYSDQRFSAAYKLAKERASA